MNCLSNSDRSSNRDRPIKRDRLRRIVSRSASMILAVSAIQAAPPNAASAFTVHGRVSDEAGRPLPYVNVVLNGNSGAMSDEQGVFRVEGVSSSTYELVLLMIGYGKTVVALDDYSPTDTLQITMHPSFTLLGDRPVAEALVDSMRAADHVRAFVVNGDGTAQATEDSICNYPILLEASPPTPDQLTSLCDAVLEASRDSCGGGPTLCSFIPEYALSFVSDNPPFDLLVSRDCHFLEFWRDCSFVPNGSGGGVRCVADDVRLIMEEIFGTDR
jgi:hypothetical protein